MYPMGHKALQKVLKQSFLVVSTETGFPINPKSRHNANVFSETTGWKSDFFFFLVGIRFVLV